MNNFLINAAISKMQSSIVNGEEVVLVKDYGDGHKAFANAAGTAVAIFAEMDEEDEGDFFNVSGWIKSKTKSLIEIADSMYA